MSTTACSHAHAATALCIVSSERVCQVFRGSIMRDHGFASLCRKLSCLHLVLVGRDFSWKFLHQVTLFTLQLWAIPRFSNTSLSMMLLWIFVNDSLRFTLARAFNRKGWWMSSTILLSGRAQRSAFKAWRPDFESGSYLSLQ